MSPPPLEGNVAILVIDMLNDYLDHRGKDFCHSCREVIPNISKLLAFGRERGWRVIYVNTSLTSPSSPMAAKWGFHPSKGSWEAEVVPELKPQGDDVLVEKTEYDGFFKTDLEQQLRKLGVNLVIPTGIHTHVCVLFTACSAFERGFEVFAMEDAMTTGTRANHENALRFYRTHLGKLMTVERLIRGTRKLDIP